MKGAVLSSLLPFLGSLLVAASSLAAEHAGGAAEPKIVSVADAPACDLPEVDRAVDVTVDDAAGDPGRPSSTRRVETAPPVLRCLHPPGLTTKGLGFLCLNSDEIGQDNDARRVYRRGTFFVEIEAEAQGGIAGARCLMYEFDRVAGDEEWPFYDYATSPEARRALQGEGVEVGTAVTEPRPGGALVTFGSITGLVVREKTKVYAFRFLVAGAAGTESSLVIFCKYDGTPPRLAGDAGEHLRPRLFMDELSVNAEEAISDF